MTTEQKQRLRAIRKSIFQEALSLQDMVHEMEGKQSIALEKAIQDIDDAVFKMDKLINVQ